MKNFLTTLAICFSIAPCKAQTLLDSIPFPGSNASFWGIHVDSDTIFIGADGPGDIVFMDPNGNIVGSLPTGHTFNHGLIKRQSSYLIAQDYTSAGANLYEISLTGASLNTWTFPPVNGGNSSGIGDLFPDGNAVWYTMYYPDFDNDPFAYAYKWIPGDPAPMDTVPLHGEQPYGVAVKGDTMFYVTDNLNGDQERIYAYDLTNEQDIGWIELPDTPTDNDMSPRGMYYDGEFLYLIANRQGGSAFAYQTIYIYGFDGTNGIQEIRSTEHIDVRPNPADDHVFFDLPFVSSQAPWIVQVFDASGGLVHTQQLRGGQE
ncbi:MAG: hypothetical protein WAR83_15105, partial [Flavobacteriales bacterium]